MAIRIVKVSEKDVEKKVKEVIYSLINRQGHNIFSIEALNKMLIKTVLEGKSVDDAWLETAMEIENRGDDSVIVKRDDFEYGIVISEIKVVPKPRKAYIIEKIKRKSEGDEDIWS